MDDDTRNLLARMERIFWIWAACDLMALLAVFLLHRLGSGISLEATGLRIAGILLLVCVAAAGVAAPILLRALFMAKTTKERCFHFRDYETLLRNVTILPMIAALGAALSYLLLVPKLHLYATMLFALYGVYSAIPSRKKLLGELTYFRNRFS